MSNYLGNCGECGEMRPCACPTPDQAGEVEQIIRWVDQAIERADKHGNTEGMWLFAKQWKAVRAALQSTPPAQPTADAVEREAIAAIVGDGIYGPTRRDTYRHVTLKIADQIIATLPTTMAGDYVMVQRELTREQWSAGYAVVDDPHHWKGFHQPGDEGAAIWDAMIAASPTGGE